MVLDLNRRKLWCHSPSAAEEVRGICSAVRAPKLVSRGCTSPPGILPWAPETEPRGRRHPHHHEAAGVPDSTDRGKCKLECLRDWKQRDYSWGTTQILPFFTAYSPLCFLYFVKKKSENASGLEGLKSCCSLKVLIKQNTLEEMERESITFPKGEKAGAGRSNCCSPST